jgi:serine/threonine-protein kinase
MKDSLKLEPDQWATLRRLLDQALDLPAPARDRWLESLSPELSDYRARLKALLANADDATHCPTVARLLDTLPKVKTAQFAAERPDADDALRAGAGVGPYRLLRRLGEGGMGEVWLAERRDILQNRQVALKLPRLVTGRTALAERLSREREILATLAHPNIARLYDAGITAAGQPWLALEYVEGERIDTYCTRKALDLPARLRLFLQVARAVAHAHARLVVHRDLKPANMLVTEGGDVRLLDFGIAKLLEAGSARETALTQLAGRALTPEYAAPEQILGQPIGTAADIYALGVVLFELLTGARPYALRRDSRAALEEAIVQAEPSRPSAAATDKRSKKRLRGDLDTIVLKALKKRPEERYGTVEALAEDLERHLDRRPVHARPDRPSYRLRMFLARNRAAVAGSAVVLASMIGGSAAALWQAAESARQRDAAVRQQVRAEAFSEFTMSLLADLGSAERPLGISELLDRASASLQQRNDLDPSTAAYMRYEVSRLYTAAVQTDKELALLSQAEQGAMQIGDLGLQAATRCAAAWSLTYRDRTTARRRLDEADVALATEPNPPVYAVLDCARARSRLLQAEGDLDGAIATAKDGIDRFDAAPTAAIRQRRGVLMTQLGDLYRASGRYREALALAEEELQWQRQAGRAGSMFELVALSNVATNLSSVGEVARSTEIYADVLARVDQLPAGSQPIGLRSGMAVNLVWQGRPEEALTLTDREIELGRQAGNGFVVALAQLTAARALMQLGRYEDALRRLGSAEALWYTDRGRYARLLQEADLVRAEMELERGQPDLARTRVAQVLERYDYPARKDRNGLDRALRLGARTALATGDIALAERYAADALAISRRIARVERASADVGRAALLRARALASLGRSAESEVDLALAREALVNGLGWGATETRQALEPPAPR